MKARPVILLADDDALLCKLLGRVLDHSGYEVVAAANGRELIERYQARRPDLVLTDIVMPVKEGIETIMQLRRLDPSAKIIAMSGGGLADPGSYLSVARKIGVADTLQKPFVHREMLDMVGRLLTVAA